MVHVFSGSIKYETLGTIFKHCGCGGLKTEPLITLLPNILVSSQNNIESFSSEGSALLAVWKRIGERSSSWRRRRQIFVEDDRGISSLLCVFFACWQDIYESIMVCTTSIKALILSTFQCDNVKNTFAFRKQWVTYYLDSTTPLSQERFFFLPLKLLATKYKQKLSSLL